MVGGGRPSHSERAHTGRGRASLNVGVAGVKRCGCGIVIPQYIVLAHIYVPYGEVGGRGGWACPAVRIAQGLALFFGCSCPVVCG